MGAGDWPWFPAAATRAVLSVLNTTGDIVLSSDPWLLPSPAQRDPCAVVKGHCILWPTLLSATHLGPPLCGRSRTKSEESHSHHPCPIRSQILLKGPGSIQIGREASPENPGVATAIVGAGRQASLETSGKVQGMRWEGVRADCTLVRRKGLAGFSCYTHLTWPKVSEAQPAVCPALPSMQVQ